MSMDYPTQIPYFADSAILPEPIPTEAQIRGSKDVLREIGVHKVVGVGPHFVVKYGTLDVIEAQNMIFVRRQTKIPVPRVYAIFETADKKCVFFVIERTQGKTLASVWSDMSNAQKNIVLQKLQAYFEELSRLPSPGYYGSIGRRQLMSGMFWIGDGAGDRIPAITGPFDTEAQLNEGIVGRSISISSDTGEPPWKGKFYRRSFPAVFHGHPPVFTHGDFQPKNVMVRSISPSSSVAQSYEVTIIDWATSGWYPSYWEYCSASWAFNWEDDWSEKIELVIKPYRVEYAWMQLLTYELGA